MLLKSIVDCHTHSNFSIDSQMPAKDAVLCAIKKGLAGLIFTDHLDLDYPNAAYDYTFDFSARSEFLDKLGMDFEDKIKIHKGIEVGFQPHVVAQSSEIIKKYDFDFVINSIHVVDKTDVCHKSFHESGSKEQVFLRYLNEIYESVDKFDDFDGLCIAALEFCRLFHRHLSSVCELRSTLCNLFDCLINGSCSLRHLINRMEQFIIRIHIHTRSQRTDYRTIYPTHRCC